MSTLPTLEDIVARVRTRLTRTRAHLRTAFAGREADVLYIVQGIWEQPVDAWVRVHEASWEEMDGPLDATRNRFFIGATRGGLLPPPKTRMTIGEGLALLDADAEQLATITGGEIYGGLLRLVPAKLRDSVCAREELILRWPWPCHRHPTARVLDLLLLSSDRLPGELTPGTWPLEVAPADVAGWKALKKLDSTLAADLLAFVTAHPMVGPTPTARDTFLLDQSRYAALAVLYATLQAVDKDTALREMAVDAGRPHHDVLMGWRDVPKDKKHTFTGSDGRIDLFTRDGKCVQLKLNLDGEGSASEALISVPRDWRGWPGLRHWAAVQKLLSVDGERQGWVRWTLDGHLEALGFSPKKRSKAEVRADVARLVEAFTKMELAAYAADGTLRERKPLLLVGAKYDRLQGSEWKLDGMQLTINPLLYSGVRDAGGKLGRNWHPAPVELAKVNDKHHPYTLALGLILPIRWRLALEEGRDHITLKGSNALDLAGIRYRARNPGAAWKALERDLTELQRIRGLGPWEWDAADTPRTLAGRLHLWPADWMADRTLRGVRPREFPLGPTVLTGEELKTWRRERDLTQAEAAKTLHVGRRTIARAEAHPSEPLPRGLAAKIREARASG